MFIAVLFTIAKCWKQSKCPSVDEWIKKVWYIYTVEYYTAVKNKEILPSVTTWIDLETVMPSKISQSVILWYLMYACLKEVDFKRITFSSITN